MEEVIAGIPPLVLGGVYLQREGDDGEPHRGKEQHNRNTQCNVLFRKSDEVDGNDTKEKIEAKLHLWFKLPKKGQKAILEAVKRKVSTRKDVLPVTSRKSSNTQAKKNRFGFKGFISCLLYSVFDIPSHYHCALFILGPSVIRYRAQTFASQFVLKLGDSFKSVLSLEEAFTEFFPLTIDMMTILQCYLLVLWLVWPLHPVLQVSVVLMLVAAPCYYIPGLVNMASGVGVSWYSFK
ncbi:unnamed protein product [Sphenostylis stenocarpa]|uniref:Uncharacterized protein n=1 Tax=Sphenostylis stenocarpa TaxID=92480 RepID=A0AA86V1L2_9FABA|nr:unnamed protein product [Sphenostylis stenocarpa]